MSTTATQISNTLNTSAQAAATILTEDAAAKTAQAQAEAERYRLAQAQLAANAANTGGTTILGLSPVMFGVAAGVVLIGAVTLYVLNKEPPKRRGLSGTKTSRKKSKRYNL